MQFLFFYIFKCIINLSVYTHDILRKQERMRINKGAFVCFKVCMYLHGGGWVKRHLLALVLLALFPHTHTKKTIIV